MYGAPTGSTPWPLGVRVRPYGPTQLSRGSALRSGRLLVRCWLPGRLAVLDRDRRSPIAGPRRRAQRLQWEWEWDRRTSTPCTPSGACQQSQKGHSPKPHEAWTPKPPVGCARPYCRIGSALKRLGARPSVGVGAAVRPPRSVARCRHRGAGGRTYSAAPAVAETSRRPDLAPGAPQVPIGTPR